MKKRIYRAVDVKAFDWSELARKLASDRLVVGIDVAKHKMFAVLMTDQEQILGVLRWDHLTQSRWFCGKLKALPVCSIETALEPSGTYGDALRQCLRAAGLGVFRVHPKHVKDAHELYDGVPSRHDAKCSAILGWLHLLGRSKPWIESSPYKRQLSAEVRTHELHAQAFRQAQNRLEAQLARHWPEVSELLELDSASLLELLHRFGGPGPVSRAPKSARLLLHQVGRGGLSEEKIEQILESSSSTVGVVMLKYERRALADLAGEARRRQQATQASKRHLRALARQEPSTANLGAVVGLVTAAVLHQELGSFLGYAHCGGLLKAAGLGLKERSSGQRKGQLAITKRGSSRVRQYLYLAVLRWLRDDPVARAWYLSKVQRDGGQLKRKSLVALMRKLLRGLFWVARGESFDSRKLFDVRRLQVA